MSDQDLFDYIKSEVSKRYNKQIKNLTELNDKEIITVVYSMIDQKRLDLLNKFFNQYPEYLNLRDDQDWDFLQYSIEGNDINIVKFFLDKNFDLNRTEEGGFTSLHIAAAKSDFEIIKLLVDKGANVNAKDIFNNTPLHISIIYRKGMDHMKYKYFVLKGSDIYSKNKDGKNPLDYIRNEELKKELIFLFNNRDKINSIYKIND